MGRGPFEPAPITETGGLPQGTSNVPLLLDEYPLTSAEAFHIDGVQDIDEARKALRHWVHEYKKISEMVSNKQRVIKALSQSVDDCNRLFLRLRSLYPEVAEDLFASTPRRCEWRPTGG